MQKKILIISHAHPDFSKGGGEIAAYTLFKTLAKKKDCEALFLARHDMYDAGHLSSPIAFYNKHNEFLFYSHTADYFNHSQAHKKSLWKYFKEFLTTHRPTIIHLHHFIHFGIEILRVIRNTLPEAKIILTLHEYAAICHHQGQMVKPKTFDLCYSSSLIDCHRCFPKITPSDFFLRERYLKSFFNLVDCFVSPSLFLIDRYVDWGIPREKLIFIENGQAITKITEIENKKTILKFGFFGRLSKLKGIDILLDAFSLLPKKQRSKIHLSIHGSDLKYQPKSFQKLFYKTIKQNKTTISYNGSYQSDELRKLMQSIDWVIIPSVWWENSPLVIQEAFKYKKPVICSDIGGMAEKVQHNLNGLHFRVGDSSSLTETIGHIIQSSQNDPEFYLNFKKNIPSVSSIEKCTEYHLKIYEDC